tara:strand:- start:33 stop:683 length:651 start_codon:yes stop_codon:yes gene_type:complete
MEVILLERIEKIGKLGDIVKVKDGFARNYLLPQNKALRASKENLSIYEKEKAKYEKLNAEKLKSAEKIAGNMKDISIDIIKQASDSGQLYGSVSTRDIADELNNKGHKILKKQVQLKSVIKTVGQHEVRIVIHPEHIVSINVNIARTLEELTFQTEEIKNIEEQKQKDAEIIEQSKTIEKNENLELDSTQQTNENEIDKKSPEEKPTDDASKKEEK